MAKRTAANDQSNATADQSPSGSSEVSAADYDKLLDEHRDLLAAHETLASEHKSLLAITTETQLPLEVHCVVMDWVAQELNSHNIRHLMLAAMEQLGIEAVESVRVFLLARCRPNMRGQVRLQFDHVAARYRVRQHELNRGKKSSSAGRSGSASVS